MIAYKLVRIKNNKLYPLFIDRKTEIPIGKWVRAKCHVTEGYAVRMGWHCTLKPYAPHLKLKLSNGELRCWVEVNIEEYSLYNRPESQGGTWVLAQKMKVNRILKVGEYI